MKELKDYTAIISILLFGIGACRILFIGEYYHISLWSFINLSNILAYTFDVLRSLIYYAVPVLFFVIFKPRLSPWLKTFKVRDYCILAGILLTIFCLWYYLGDMNFISTFLLKYVLLAFLFFVGVIAKFWSEKSGTERLLIRDFDTVKFSLLIVFLYCYLKVDFKFSKNDINTRKRSTVSTIVMKLPDNRDSIVVTDSTRYVVLSTAEYIFLYDEKTKGSTAIPVPNILFHTTNAKR